MRVDRRTLADAILAVSIGELDWHAGQIVKGEDESALALANLIGDEYDRMAGPQVSEIGLFLNAIADAAKLDDETRTAFLRTMGRTG